MSAADPTRASPKLTDNLRGIMALSAGVFIFSFQDVIIKLLSGTYPVHQIVFVRGLIALPLLFLAVAWESGLGALQTQRPLMHLLRSTVMFGAFLFYYLAMPALPLTAVVALWFTSPLFITALSVPILGEHVGWRRWVGILIGFAGALVMIRPGAESFQIAALLPVAAAMCYALAQVLGRKIGVTESGSVMAFYTNATFLYLGAAIAMVAGDLGPGGDAGGTLGFLTRGWVMPHGIELALLGMVGLISAIGFVLLMQAYRIGTAAAVAPFEYTAMLWASALAFLVWGEVPGPYTIIGAAMIAAGGLYVLSREAASGKRSLAAHGLWRTRS